ncbi:unnamed protein product [Polarella glacialis]|uniref:DUF493 family protein n=1 Tax=Polarella glacialis TaxID=89957 RepID=A0A813I2M1_POLGL|nr:unnamed protein product [Polarella glacialis]
MGCRRLRDLRNFHGAAAHIMPRRVHSAAALGAIVWGISTGLRGCFVSLPGRPSAALLARHSDFTSFAVSGPAARRRCAVTVVAGAGAPEEDADAPSNESPSGEEPLLPGDSFEAREAPRSAQSAGHAKGGYSFVSGHQDEARAISGDVLKRVNMVSRAQQDLYKSPEGVPDTERGISALTGALLTFPAEHGFQAVGKTANSVERDEFVRLVTAAVEQHTGDLAENAVSVRERMGGRYVSVSVRQTVSGAEQINLVLEQLRQTPQVIMHW